MKVSSCVRISADCERHSPVIPCAGGSSPGRIPLKDDGDEEEELALVMRRLEAAKPPAEVLKVWVAGLVMPPTCFLGFQHFEPSVTNVLESL